MDLNPIALELLHVYVLPAISRSRGWNDPRLAFLLWSAGAPTTFDEEDPGRPRDDKDCFCDTMRWPCGLLTFSVELSAHTLVTFSASAVADARRGISKYPDDVSGFAGGVAGTDGLVGTRAGGVDGLDGGTEAGAEGGAGGGADGISSGSSVKTGAISGALSDESLTTIDGASWLGFGSVDPEGSEGGWVLWGAG